MSREALEVIVLGSDGSWPSRGGACSGYLLRTEATTIWIDAGSGTLARLQEYVSLDEIDAVVLTHAHPDHCSDIVGLCVYARYGVERALDTRVFAAKGVREFLFPHKSVEEVLSWHVIADAQQVQVNDVELTFSRTTHGPLTFAVLAKADETTFAYSSDTGTGWSFANFKEAHIDLAMCEAAFAPGTTGNGHLSPEQAAEMARDSNVDRLVLTHLRPTVDRKAAEVAATEVFGKAVEIAAIGDRYKVKSRVSSEWQKPVTNRG